MNKPSIFEIRKADQARLYAKEGARRERIRKSVAINRKKRRIDAVLDARDGTDGTIPSGVLVDGERFMWAGSPIPGSAEARLEITRREFDRRMRDGILFAEIVARADSFTRTNPVGRRASRTVIHNGAEIASTAFAKMIGRHPNTVAKLIDRGFNAEQIIAFEAKPGRPKGAKSKPKAEPVTKDQVEALLKGLDDAPINSPVLEDTHPVREFKAALAEPPVEHAEQERRVEQERQVSRPRPTRSPISPSASKVDASFDRPTKQPVEQEPQVGAAALSSTSRGDEPLPREFDLSSARASIADRPSDKTAYRSPRDLEWTLPDLLAPK